MRNLVFLVLLALLGGRLPTAAGQASPPPGGFAWRVVDTLARVALPPGGLVPYRQGHAWGYADTTGRVVMRPVLTSEPPFFMDDFIGVSLVDMPQLFGNHDPRYSGAVRHELAQSVCLINGRGDVLLLNQARSEVPLLLADSSLRAGVVAEHLGQPALRPDFEAGFGSGRWRLGIVSVDDICYPIEVTPPHHWRKQLNYPVGARRFAARRTVPRRLPGKFSGHSSLPRRFTGPRMALVDSAGRRLTGWYFGSINPFQNGRALVYGYRPHRARSVAPGRVPRQASRNVLYLDRQGRELRLPAEVAIASNFQQGTAVVWRRRWPGGLPPPTMLVQGGIIDTLGRWLLPFSSRLQGPDAEGLLRVMQVRKGDTLVRFINRKAASVAGGRTFRQAGPFFNRRAWVQAADGRQGLIDLQGRWVTPASDYDLLVSVTQRAGFMRGRELWTHDQPVPMPQFSSPNFANWQPADTAYMLCRRAGKYGWVARRTGREVIPARYDSVGYYLAEGVACAYRAGQPYLLTARGCELARGQYRGDWYDYPGQPRHLYRPAEGTWSAVDTSGRARLPWLSGTGCLTPEGRAVVQESYTPNWQQLPRAQQVFPRLRIVEADGHTRVAPPSEHLVQYSGRPVAMQLPSVVSVHHSPPLFWLSEEVTAVPSEVYRLATPAGITQLLRATDLRPFTPGLFTAPRVLPNGWHAATRVADTLAVLISPTGRQWAAPPGMVWSRYPYQVGAGRSQQHKERLPFQYGVEKVLWKKTLRRPLNLYSLPNGVEGEDELREGYLTRGGTRLWAD